MAEVEIVNINTQPAQKSMVSLRQEVKQLREQLYSLEQGTTEYNKVLAELGEKQRTIAETTYRINEASTDFSNNIQNATGTMAGMVGAVQTAVGAFSLMGVEMGDDVKLIKDLQALMAITTGFAAIQSGVTSFRRLTEGIKMATASMSALNKTMAASVFGAVALAVGILVNQLHKLKAEQQEAAEEAERHNQALRDQLDITKQITNATTDYYERQYSQLAIIRSVEKRLAKDRAMWQEEYKKGNINQYELDKKLQGEQITIRTNAGKKMQEIYQGILAHNADADWKYSKEGKKAWNDYYTFRAVAAYGNLEEEKRVMQEWEQYNNGMTKKQKAIVSRVAKETNQAAKDEIEADTPWYFVDTEYLERETDILLRREADMTEQLIMLDMERNQRREEILRQNLENQLIDQTEFDEQMAQLAKEAAQLQNELEDEQTRKTEEANEARMKKHEESLKAQQETYRAYSRAVSSITSSIGSILGSIGDTMEQGAGKWKAVKTAEAIISTLQGGVSAYMGMIESIPGPAGIAAGALAAAATVASGMAEVKKIQDTKLTASNPTSSTTSLGNVNAQAISVAATQVTNTRSTNTTTDIENLPETRVYVLESDITSAQNNVRTTVRNATF